MPQFTTISPTHIPGKKAIAWERFRDGNYIAIGFKDIDMSKIDLSDLNNALSKLGYEKDARAVDYFRKFLSLKIGDHIAVNNTNHGLFGIGIVTGGYFFKMHGHNSETSEKSEWYSHFISVDWKITQYMRRQELIQEGEKMWAPYGTIGSLLASVPDYINRALDDKSCEPKTPTLPNALETPQWLESLVNDISVLRGDPNHLERAHESLVEDFLVSLGYKKHSDIKYRQGRIDITLYSSGQPKVLFEVKRDWEMNIDNRDVIKQAYNYSLEQGIRFVVITNGDYYLLMDRLKGLSFESNIVGEFTLSVLQEDSLELISSLRPEQIKEEKIGQVLSRLSECF